MISAGSSMPIEFPSAMQWKRVDTRRVVGGFADLPVPVLHRMLFSKPGVDADSSSSAVASSSQGTIPQNSAVTAMDISANDEVKQPDGPPLVSAVNVVAGVNGTKGAPVKSNHRKTERGLPLADVQLQDTLSWFGLVTCRASM